MTVKCLIDLLFWIIIIKTGFGNRCADDTFHSDIATTSNCSALEDCYFGKLQQLYPTLYNPTGWRRDPPDEPKVSTFCKNDSSGVNQAGINIQWRLPNSFSASGIEGFELRIEGELTDYRCLIIKLEEKVTQYKKNSMFNNTLYPVSRKTHFKIIIHSLPRANDSISVSKDVATLQCPRFKPSCDWSPAYHNETYNGKDMTLIVWFSAPPAEFKMVEYEIGLKPTPRDVYRNQNKIVNSTEVRFTHVEPGNYTIYLQPYDPHPFDNNLCICRDDENECDRCKQTQWTIEIKPPTPKVTDVARSATTSVVAVAVVCGSLVFFFVLGFVLYKVVGRRYGISLDFGQCKTGKNGHVIVIDASSYSEKVTEFHCLLKKQLANKATLRMFLYDKNTSQNLHTLGQNYTQSSLGCCRMLTKSQNTTMLVCLLVDEKSIENYANIQENVRSYFPTNDMFVTISFHNETASVPKICGNFYIFETDQLKITDFIQKVFKQKGRGEAVTYTSTLVPKEPETKVSLDKLGCYVSLPNVDSSRIGIENNRIPDMSGDVTGDVIPGFLSCQDHRRERYISNDSGRGGSEYSFKQCQSSDETPEVWDDNHCIKPADATNYNHVPKNMNFSVDKGYNSRPQIISTKGIQNTNLNDTKAMYRPEKEPCSSCDISFFPPDPSIISESEFDIGDADDIPADRSIPQKTLYKNCYHHEKTALGKSMDSLMDKLAQINERSAMMKHQAEVYSLYDGQA